MSMFILTWIVRRQMVSIDQLNEYVRSRGNIHSIMPFECGESYKNRNKYIFTAQIHYRCQNGAKHRIERRRAVAHWIHCKTECSAPSKPTILMKRPILIQIQCGHHRRFIAFPMNCLLFNSCTNILTSIYKHLGWWWRWRCAASKSHTKTTHSQ